MKEIHQSLVDTKRFDIWIDFTHMAAGGGNVLEEMSAAIDDADLVLVCVSREYYDSANCRLEAEYAHVKKKKIKFLMMQENYTSPSGWLGMLVGAKLWHAFFSAPGSGSTTANEVHALLAGGT